MTAQIQNESRITICKNCSCITFLNVTFYKGNLNFCGFCENLRDHETKEEKK